MVEIANEDSEAVANMLRVNRSGQAEIKHKFYKATKEFFGFAELQRVLGEGKLEELVFRQGRSSI